jgi:quercetin dioxygenase-like cupin family protein
VLREGDSLHFRAHLEHGYVNLSDRVAVLVMVVRPRLTL